MKKIREILFTIVVIASCGCLLNVNIFASLPKNYDLIETESVSGKEEAAEEEEEERKFKKWLETTLDAYSPPPPELCLIVDRVDSIDEALENRIQNSLPNVSQEWVISNVVADNDGAVLFCNNFLDHSRVTTYRTNMVDGTMVVDASTYDDLSEVYVSEGQAVKKGQKIGEKKYLNFNPAPDKNMIFYNFYEKFPDLTIDKPDSFFPESQGMHRRLKPCEEWLAEYKKNEREGNFELPSFYMEEEEEEKLTDIPRGQGRLLLEPNGPTFFNGDPYSD